MRGRIWSARSALGVGVGITALLVGLAASTVWLLDRTDGDDGAGIANVLALPVAVLFGLPSLVWGWRARPRADDPAVLAREARKLLDVVTTDETRTLAKLLGDTGYARPADIGFTQPKAAQVTWRGDGGATTGSLSTIADYYDTLDLGRLVVLGAPGAGKTVLVLQLLRDLAIRAQRALEPGSRTKVRIPVRLSLPSFVVPSTVVDPARIRTAFDDWMVTQLTTRGVRKATAHALLAHGWILPVLDGLDEMDPDDSNAPRARRTLAALNDPVGPTPRPVVLTCRTQRYDQLARNTGTALQDATAVTLQPLDAEQVIAWLAYRFPDPTQPDGLQRRWRRVATILRRHPRGRLATCLITPLHLYLATAIYRGSDTKPGQLCEMDADELEQFLFDQLVPALTSHHPRDKHTHYRPDDVRRWLNTLADHLAVMAQRGRSSVELYPLELWRTNKHAQHTRHGTAVLSAGVIMLVAALFFNESLLTAALVAIPIGWSAYHKDVPSTLSAYSKVFPGTARGAAGAAHRLERIDLRVLAIAVPVHATLFFIYSGLTSLAEKLWLGAVFGGLHLLILAVVSTPQHAVERPSRTLRQPVLHDFTKYGFFFFFMYVNARTLFHLEGTPSLEALSPKSLLQGLPYYGVLMLIVLNADGKSQHFVSALRPSHSKHLPRRLGRFLDWAYHAGLLRMSGTAIQFRHQDLQTHFTTPRTRPTDQHEHARR